MAIDPQQVLNNIPQYNPASKITEPSPAVNTPTTQSTTTSTQQSTTDWRARLRPMSNLLLGSGNTVEKSKTTDSSNNSAVADGIYGPVNGSNVLSILHQTNGLLFPYTPNLSVSPSSDYQTYAPVHANANWHTFVRNNSATIQINGTFTAQTPSQAHYVVACIHFLKTIVKMRFGTLDPKRGTPPPLLLFDAYGFYMFNQLPVIVKGFTVNYENSSDFIPIDLSSFSDGKNISPIVTGTNLNNSTLTWVPSKLSISLDMVVQVQPRLWRKEFNLNDFKTGNLMKTQSKYSKRTGGWI